MHTQTEAAELRGRIRAGWHTGPTAGLAHGAVQTNLVILPAADAADFAAFCRLNSQACPLVEQLAPGDPQPRQSAPGADLRTDLPRYRVFRNGEPDSQEPTDICALWQDDFVAFLLGCSFTFENALSAAGLPVRHWQTSSNVPMYRTNIACRPAGKFAGPLVVSMRPYLPEQIEAVSAITGRFPQMHGAPVHVGDPASIGITNVGRPDFGDPVEIRSGELPVFWACGVTPQLAVRSAAGDSHHAQPGLHVRHGLARIGIRYGWRARGGESMNPARQPNPEAFPIDWCRGQFPSLARQVDGRPAVFFDGPAGSQVPQKVIDAVTRYYVECNANHGGRFLTSRQSDALLDSAHEAVADLFGAADAGTVAFGANMTTLTLGLSRALAREWKPGDEVLVTRLDHDANVTPWVLAARDAGAILRHVEIRPDDCTLDMDDLKAKLSPRTRLVAVGCTLNAVGTVNPVAGIAALAHAVGAEIFVDAVHAAPHLLADVVAWDCDFLVASAYKFFGPHLGMLWGRRGRLEALPAYKLRPAPDELPGKWMTGTQSHEAIAGTLAAVDYLADLGRTVAPAASSRRQALVAAYAAIGSYERSLAQQLLTGLANLPGVKIYGIAAADRLPERVPTFGIRHARLAPDAVADFLDERGIFVWHGNFYALPLTEALGLEPEGLVRIGLLHYNTAAEVERLLSALAELE